MEHQAAQHNEVLKKFPVMGPVPAVLLGGPDLLRPLGMAGIRVIVVSSNPRSISFHSRFCTAYHLLPPRENMEAVAQSIEKLGEKLSRAYAAKVPLFYGDDYYLELLQTRHGSLSPYFRFLLNDPDVATALINKQSFRELAEGRGLPVPHALDWELLSGATGPVIVKPKSKIHWDRSKQVRGFLGTKARIFDSGGELASLGLEGSLKEQLLIQEFVPGDDGQIVSFHGFADENGRLLAGFTGRKIRTFPVLTGESSYLELIVDDELAAFGQKIAERLPLKGAFKIDIKRHSGTGMLYVLEINARFNLWHHLGAKNGVNLPVAAYEYLVHGRRPVATKVTTRYRWLSFGLDYQSFRALSAKGQLSAPQWVWSLLRSRKIYHLFSWQDPMPFLVYQFRRVRSFLSRFGHFSR